MNYKLVLDIVMGSVIPIIILNNLNEQLGTETTIRFNFITSYVGAFAMLRGLLAFWFVDGLQFAFKDSIGFIFTAMVFGGSMVIRRPIIRYFLIQGLGPSSPEQEKSLKELLRQSRVYRSLFKATKILLMINLVTGVANFLINLQIVVADFGTTMFNQQVAQVNAITHI